VQLAFVFCWRVNLFGSKFFGGAANFLLKEPDEMLREFEAQFIGYFGY